MTSTRHILTAALPSTAVAGLYCALALLPTMVRRGMPFGLYLAHGRRLVAKRGAEQLRRYLPARHLGRSGSDAPLAKSSPTRYIARNAAAIRSKSRTSCLGRKAGVSRAGEEALAVSLNPAHGKLLAQIDRTPHT